MKRNWIIAICLISLVVLSGCNNSEPSDEGSDLDQKDLNGVTTDSVEEREHKEEETEKEETEKDIILYFSDYQAEYTVAEIRNVEVEGNIEETIFKELKKGPENEELYAVIPDKTKLLSIQTKDGVCTVDLSEEFVSNQPGGTAAETITINSIVNTLTELEHIDSVQFRVEGNIREVLVHQELDRPIKRNESIIEK
ncbi:GerMN domain-containing protein [Herbivorax sp. ANBcel31]|uniref:GerMN domain-containing protein n=1 Tax=Herbivorax sp. ANBcel31 TaxID=3069754 RepID=UPI0027B1C6C4|nr:GerMN domain-containing protein [Herbivorax sp. ANBcel31]MDQ2087386.1 GerMN domain-containing protein [Herbivorax sp. ANBcel31]